MDSCMAYAAEYRSGKVEAEIRYMPELVVDVIAEDEEEEHIPENVHVTAVQKGITDELP